jgi:hypothetical protein
MVGTKLMVFPLRLSPAQTSCIFLGDLITCMNGDLSRI